MIFVCISYLIHLTVYSTSCVHSLVRIVAMEKLYDVNFDNIDDIATTSWTPQMSLTDEERKVVEAKGTVLLLGRSGTGKTIVSQSSCFISCTSDLFIAVSPNFLSYSQQSAFATV